MCSFIFHRVWKPYLLKNAVKKNSFFSLGKNMHSFFSFFLTRALVACRVPFELSRVFWSLQNANLFRALGWTRRLAIEYFENREKAITRYIGHRLTRRVFPHVSSINSFALRKPRMPKVLAKSHAPTCRADDASARWAAKGQGYTSDTLECSTHLIYNPNIGKYFSSLDEKKSHFRDIKTNMQLCTKIEVIFLSTRVQ